MSYPVGGVISYVRLISCASYGNRQVPRWSLTSTREAMVQSHYEPWIEPEREARINEFHHPLIPLRTRRQRYVKPFFIIFPCPRSIRVRIPRQYRNNDSAPGARSTRNMRCYSCRSITSSVATKPGTKGGGSWVGECQGKSATLTRRRIE